MKARGERDPLLDPRPGDLVTNGRRAVLVLERTEDEVGALRYHGAEPCSGCIDCHAFAVDLWDWRLGCAWGMARVLAMGIVPSARDRRLRKGHSRCSVCGEKGHNARRHASG